MKFIRSLKLLIYAFAADIRRRRLERAVTVRENDGAPLCDAEVVRMAVYAARTAERFEAYKKAFKSLT